MTAAGCGLALEAATEHVEVAVQRPDGGVLAHVVEDVGHGHTRRLAALVEAALAEAGVRVADLGWIAADLGPGSFTGVRVGLATARALAMVSGARLLGASSLAALAHGSDARDALVVPLVPAGRRDLYAGFFRADRRGEIRLVQAPMVGTPALVLDRVAESLALLGKVDPRFVGPGAVRERATLEHSHPGAASPWRAEGLSALDLARAARAGSGPAAGLPSPDDAPEPVYVRTAQAEERVRHAALAGVPLRLRPLVEEDVPAIAEIERRVFHDPWPATFFRSELRLPDMHARVAERHGEIAGYSLAWLGADAGHLGNLAVAPGTRRVGVGAALLDDLLRRAGQLGVRNITLEVRVSNAAAQGLYRSRGFRLAGLRRRYYRDNGEDALVMEWRAAARATSATTAARA